MSTIVVWFKVKAAKEATLVAKGDVLTVDLFLYYVLTCNVDGDSRFLPACLSIRYDGGQRDCYFNRRNIASYDENIIRTLRSYQAWASHALYCNGLDAWSPQAANGKL